MWGCEGQFPSGEFKRGGEGHGTGDVLGAGAAVALLASAMEDGFGGDPGAQVERADALGRAELVAAEGDSVSAEVRDADGESAAGLHGVGVEGDAVCVCHPADFGDRLDRADLVIGEHDRDESRVWVLAESTLDVLRVEEALVVYRKEVDAKAVVSMEEVAGCEDGFVLDGRGEDAATVWSGEGNAFEGEVVGFGAAGGEDDLVGAAAKDSGDALAGLLEGAGGPVS